ncbi:MAG TPA: MerR family transcriptional regulator [Solirubrobacteraceae bacterium]|nr:MerR family transcriptional regulator [Solirubrobacteraceae bacterium]
MQAPTAEALTINEAAETTGWSARMLRYIERVGLVEPARSSSGYRLYGPPELQRLRTLRELLDRFDLGLGEVGFALRLRRESRLRESIDGWLSAEPARPEHVAAEDWLSFEQDKHQRLLAASADAGRDLGHPSAIGHPTAIGHSSAADPRHLTGAESGAQSETGLPAFTSIMETV